MSMPPPPPGGFQPQYGTASVPHPKGTTVLVLGIVSFFCFGIITGVIAYVMGTNALKEIDANPGYYNNRGTVNAGRICGIIGAVLSLIGIIYVLGRS